MKKLKRDTYVGLGVFAPGLPIGVVYLVSMIVVDDVDLANIFLTYGVDLPVVTSILNYSSLPGLYLMLLNISIVLFPVLVGYCLYVFETFKRYYINNDVHILAHFYCLFVSAGFIAMMWLLPADGPKYQSIFEYLIFFYPVMIYPLYLFYFVVAKFIFHLKNNITHNT